MVDAGLDRGVDGAQQVVVGLPRRAVDEVEVDVVEARGERLARRGERPARRVHPVQRRQHVRGHRLHAQRHPRVAGRPQLLRTTAATSTPGWPRWSPRRRRPARSARGPRRAPRPGPSPPSSDGVPPPTNTVSHRRQRPSRAAASSSSARSACQPAVGVRAAQLGGRVGVEVAVAAASRAERHMDVDAERPARRSAAQAAGSDPQAHSADSDRHADQFPQTRAFAHRERKSGPVRA